MAQVVCVTPPPTEINPNPSPVCTVASASPFVGIVGTAPSLITALNVGFFEPVSAFIGGPKDPAPNQISFGPWIHVAGGVNHITTGAPDILSDIRTDVNFAGFRGGGDLGIFNINGTGWNAHAGLIAGTVSASLKQPVLGSSSDFDIPFAGVYAALTHPSGFTADLLFHRNFGDGHMTDPAIGLLDQSYKFTSSSLAGTVAYQFLVGDAFYVSPMLGFVYATTSPGFVPVTGGSLTQDKYNSFLGRVGLKVGTAVQLSDAIAVSPFIQASLWHEFNDSATAVLTIPGGVVVPVRSDLVGTFGQVGAGLAVRSTTTEWVGFVRADVRFGEDVNGVGVNAGLRYQF